MDFVKSIGSSVVQKFDSLQGTELEKKVKEATSNENWGTSSTVKNEIADATFDYQAFREIMGILWKRLAEKDNNWRIVFKSLELLMHLLKCGHDRVIDDIRDHQYTLKSLQNFSYSDPTNGQDRGRGIRLLAQQIVELVGDNKRLREARDEAQKQRRKLQDVNETGVSNESYRSSYKSHSYDRDNDRDRDRDRERERRDREREDDNEDDSHKTKKKRKSKSKEKDDEFAVWTDDENDTKKKPKKKKPQKEEDAEETEERSDKDKDEEDDSEITKKKKKSQPKKKGVKPTQPMQFVESPEVAPSKKPSAKKEEPNLFEFDQMSSALPSTTSNKAAYDDFSSFDTPPPTNTSTTVKSQGNNGIIGFDDFGFENNTAKQQQSSGNNGFWDNTQTTTTQSGDLFDNFGSSNVAGNGVGDLFGTFESNNNDNNKEVIIKKTTLSGAVKEEKVTMKKGTEPTKTKTNDNDAWGLGGNLVNLDNLSKTTTTYAAFNPDAKAANNTGSGIPQLTTYGANRPQFTSLGGINTMGMPTNNMGMNPGMGMNPNMGMGGMNPNMGMGGMNPNMGMGMNPGMSMGMNPNMGMGGMNPGMGMGMGGMNPGMGTGMNFSSFGTSSNQNMWQ